MSATYGKIKKILALSEDAILRFMPVVGHEVGDHNGDFFAIFSNQVSPLGGASLATFPAVALVGSRGFVEIH